MDLQIIDKVLVVNPGEIFFKFPTSVAMPFYPAGVGCCSAWRAFSTIFPRRWEKALRAHSIQREIGLVWIGNRKEKQFRRAGSARWYDCGWPDEINEHAQWRIGSILSVGDGLPWTAWSAKHNSIEH